MLRGTSLFLVSPNGWQPGRTVNQWNPKEPSLIFEVPRTNCFLHWSGEPEEVEEIAKKHFTSRPFGPEAPVEMLQVIPKVDSAQLGDA